jgi:hypothetical protein
MILSTAAFLTLVGFLAWIVGAIFGHQEVAVIGATIVLGVGAMIVGGGGLEQKTGERVTQTSNNTTVTEFQYQKVDTPTQLPLGLLLVLLGGVLTIHGVNDVGGGSV